MSKGRTAGRVGTVRERGPGRWQLRYFDAATGKQMARTVQATSRTAAERALVDFVAEVRRGEAGLAPARMTVGDLLDEWFAAKHFESDSNRSLHEWAIRKHLKPALGGARLHRLRLGDVQRAYKTIGEHLSPKSVRHVHNTLREALDYAVRADHLTKNVATRVEGLPKVDERTVKAPKPAEVQAYLAAVRERGWQWWAYTVLTVATGMRRAELCGLRWEDVDLDAGVLHIRRDAIRIKHSGKAIRQATKTDGSTRQLSLGPEALAVLAEVRQRAETAAASVDATLEGDRYVFSPDPAGEDFYDPNYISRLFREVADSLDGNTVRPHKLRHYAATQAAKAGVPLSEIMGRFGWTNYKTALKYQHYTGAHDQRAAAAALDGLDLTPPSDAQVIPLARRGAR